MAFEIKSVAVDENKEEHGVWHEIGGGQLKIAALNNNAYQRELDMMSKNRRKKFDNTISGNARPTDPTMGEEEFEQVLTDIMAKTILVDWSGLTEDGKEVPYSVDKAREYLRTYRYFRNLVLNYAADMESFFAEQEESEAKNSKTGSSGT